MSFKKISVRHAVCLRCGYAWVPRVKGRPKKCAGCADPLWDQDRIYAKEGKPKPKRKPKKKS